jgi:hypothetical protein
MKKLHKKSYSIESYKKNNYCKNIKRLYDQEKNDIGRFVEIKPRIKP